MLLTVDNSYYIHVAEELLKGRFSTAADTISLEFSLLELACDLELPSGGEGWHSLRNEELPQGFRYTCMYNVHVHV